MQVLLHLAQPALGHLRDDALLSVFRGKTACDGCCSRSRKRAKRAVSEEPEEEEEEALRAESEGELAKEAKTAAEQEATAAASVAFDTDICQLQVPSLASRS